MIIFIWDQQPMRQKLQQKTTFHMWLMRQENIYTKFR